MRYVLILVCTCLLASSHLNAQYKSYALSPRGDTINIIDLSGKKQGPWIVSIPALRGEPAYEAQGYYLNDRREGQWQMYSEHGDLIAIENYRWGNKNGKNLYFTRVGQPLREEMWKAVNPDDPYDTVDVYDMVDPTRVVERVVVKLEGYTLKHGLWKYYDPEYGTIVKTERYHLDKLRTELDDLQPIDPGAGEYSSTSKSDTATKKAAPKPQAIIDYEKKNSGKKKIKVRDGRTGG